MTDYATFLASKRQSAEPSGFTVDEAAISPVLFDWQRAIVRWALYQGRAALFEECGLGKTLQQLEWARHVALHTGRQVLIVAPLAVAGQTIREAGKLGLPVAYVRDQAEALAAGGVVITNYDRLEAFDAGAFGGVVLDESSILKAFSGATKKRLVSMFADTPYRLACTATPAPNDHVELGNHAEFLGLMPSSEMLARWFINDQGKAGNYRLKGHAAADFWRWITSWAVCIATPSDLGSGYSDAGFVMPPLHIHEERVQVDYARAHEHGRLFLDETVSATAMWKEKRATLDERCAAVARIVAARPGEPWIVWCETNDEADRLQLLLPEAIEVRGNHSLAVKEERLNAFSEGRARIIITKPGLAGFGLNWQHCGLQVFTGVTYSFENLYQALRRSLRYGRVGDVSAWLVYAESEGSIMAALKRKQEEHILMQQAMTEAQHTHGLFREDGRLELTPAPSEVAHGRGWTLHLGDCVAEARRIDSGIVDFSIFSPPFSQLYTYSASEADMGNCASDDEFFVHFGYLLPELLRITKPGRLCAVHCKDLPRYQSSHGAAGLYDFPGEIVRAFEAARLPGDDVTRWQFHSRVTIWKDPVIEASRTNNHGLLFKNFSDRAEVCRQGMADYLLVFRKWVPEMPDKQVKQRRAPGDYIGTAPPPNTGNDRDYAIAVWQRYASPVWFDINQTDVLNERLARDDKDTKHICPLQLGVIRRAIDLWTNPGELVFSPFAGIGSEGVVALESGRQFVGIELKDVYHAQAVRFLETAAGSQDQLQLWEEAA